jgi:hypothetical protein
MNGGELIGLAAVVLTTGIPIASMYLYFLVRRLKTEDRMAAIARGVAVPMEPELSQVARSRRAGILLVCTALGWTATFALIGRMEHDAFVASYFGLIPFAIGVGFFLDSIMVKRDLQAHS